MEKITYHKAGLNDISVLVDHRILFAIELSGEQNPEATNALKLQMADYFSKAMQTNTCISFIAKCDDQVAGIGSVMVREQPGNFKNPSGKWGYIMNMYTVPAFRRKGICGRLLQHLVEDAGAMDITAFELHATPTGEFVYKKEGFLIHGEPTYRKHIE